MRFSCVDHRSKLPSRTSTYLCIVMEMLWNVDPIRVWSIALKVLGLVGLGSGQQIRRTSPYWVLKLTILQEPSICDFAIFKKNNFDFLEIKVDVKKWTSKSWVTGNQTSRCLTNCAKSFWFVQLEIMRYSVSFFRLNKLVKWTNF